MNEIQDNDEPDKPKPACQDSIRGNINEEKDRNALPNDGNVLLPFGLRYPIQNATRLDWFLLAYNWGFLFPICLILYLVLFISKVSQ
jgi:hypothetical protein